MRSTTAKIISGKALGYFENVLKRLLNTTHARYLMYLLKLIEPLSDVEGLFRLDISSLELVSF